MHIPVVDNTLICAVKEKNGFEGLIVKIYSLSTAVHTDQLSQVAILYI